MTVRLLYLIMVRVFGWLALLARSDAAAVGGQRRDLALLRAVGATPRQIRRPGHRRHRRQREMFERELGLGGAGARCVAGGGARGAELLYQANGLGPEEARQVDE